MVGSRPDGAAALHPRCVGGTVPSSRVAAVRRVETTPSGAALATVAAVSTALMKPQASTGCSLWRLTLSTGLACNCWPRRAAFRMLGARIHAGERLVRLSIYVYGYLMEVRRSARRHGPSEESVFHVIDTAVALLLINSPYGTMTMCLGFAQDGRPIEVGTVDDPDDGETIIHAMPMRKAFRDRMPHRRGQSR